MRVHRKESLMFYKDVHASYKGALIGDVNIFYDDTLVGDLLIFLTRAH
jgi:hypothetical protein